MSNATALGDIVEIALTNLEGCNFYLTSGWRLLDMGITTRKRVRDEKDGVPWLQTRMAFVVGRDAATAHVEFDYKPEVDGV